MLSLLRFLLLLSLAEMAPDESDADEEEDEDEEEPDSGETHDAEARIRSLVAANDRLAKKNKKLQRAIAESETTGDGLLDLQRENAFLRAVMERGDALDMETAWDLLHVRGFVDTVSANEDGKVTGMSDALDKLLDRYPWLTDELPESDEDDPDRPTRSAPPPKKRRVGAGVGPSKADLQKRFPSLRKRR